MEEKASDAICAWNGYPHGDARSENVIVGGGSDDVRYGGFRGRVTLIVTAYCGL